MFNYYVGKPNFLMGIGNVYPVKVFEIEEFKEFVALTNIIYGKQFLKNRLKIDVEYLLDFYLVQTENFIEDFKKILNITLKKEVDFVYKEEGEYGFRVVGESFEVNKYNFDNYRELIMKQNLLFEPYTEEDDLLQEWLELARETKSRQGEPTDLESICQVVSIYKGCSLDSILNSTYYGLMAEYRRISLMETNRFIMLLRSQGCDEKLINISQIINLDEHPDSDLIKKENIKSAGDL